MSRTVAATRQKCPYVHPTCTVDISLSVYICVATEHGKKKKQKKAGRKKSKGDKLGQHAESQASLGSDEGHSATDINVSFCLL